MESVGLSIGIENDMPKVKVTGYRINLHCLWVPGELDLDRLSYIYMRIIIISVFTSCSIWF